MYMLVDDAQEKCDVLVLVMHKSAMFDLMMHKKSAMFGLVMHILFS